MSFDDVFAGTRGNRNGSVMIVGESWGSTEAIKHKPFVGESGRDLEQLLYQARIPINECFFTNVVNAQPLKNDMKKFFYKTAEARLGHHVEVRGLYPQQIVLDGLEKLRKQIALVQPKIIIGLGNYTLWALTEDSFSVGDDSGYKAPTGISQWRGSQLYTSDSFGKTPFLPTYHPAAGLRTYAWRFMIKHDLSVRYPKLEQWDEPNYDFAILPSFANVTQYLNDLLRDLERSRCKVVLDLETSISRKLISCIGLSRDKDSAICIPLLCRNGNEGNYWGFEEELIIVQLLRKILAHPNLQLIGHNLLFDLQYIIDQLFVKPVIWFDTMIAQHTLWPGGGDPDDAKKSAKTFAQGVQRKALYNCASLYCNHYYFWKEEGKDFDSTSRDELQGWTYNCRDCVKTFEVYEAQELLLAQFSLTQQFDFQMQVANKMALPMMLRGVKVNLETKNAINKELTTALEEYDEHLLDMMPEEIRNAVAPKGYKQGKFKGMKVKSQWYESPKQQAVIFYDFLGIKPILHPKTKNPTLNKDSLPILAQREPIIEPIVDKIEVRRSLGVYQSTFAEMEADPDDRLRCSYNVTGTDTYRFSSSENIYDRGGNFQNIPSGKEDEFYKFPNMRRHFEPDIGYEIAEFDLAGADAQVVAWEANDLDLMDAFLAGKSVHIKNARDIFPHRTKDLTDDEIKAGSGIPGSVYDGVKKGVHATNYGGTARTLASKLRWRLSEAEEFQENWFRLHPSIRNWHTRTERTISGLQCWRCASLTNGKSICPRCGATCGRTVGNKFGFRVVYFDHIQDIANKALAWVPQSTVAITCNKGAIALIDNVPWVELLLQVHDSLVVQYPIKYSDRLGDIKKALNSVIIPYHPRTLTIQWSPKVSRKNWGDCQKISW